MIKKNKFLSFFILILFSFSLAAEDSSKSASDYFVLAEKEIEEENWYSAYQYLLETVTKNPDYQKAWFLLAECSYQLDEFDLTLSYLENAEKYFPSDSKILNLRGMTYISLGKTLEAEKIFDEVLKIYPNDVTARFGRAELFLLNGKYTAAEKEYENALFREISNRKALLSLALLLGKQGKYKEAQEYIQKALNFYTGNADVYYYSAILYVMQGDYKNAEKRVRLSLELNPAEDKFYELLANILYRLSQYEEVINICDYRIEHDRSRKTAWYLKGFAEYKLSDFESAINTWSQGCEISGDDEIMRAALEILVNSFVDIEDERRFLWSKYHVENALEYSKRFDYPGTAFEYQRALKIEPFNFDARYQFAQVLKLNGYNESYLNQLRFISENQEKDKISRELSDSIESYTSLLSNSLSKKWKIEPFYLDKTRYKIGIFYKDSNSYSMHVENNFVAAKYASEVFSGLSKTNISTEVNQISNFAEAYKTARKSGCDFFLVLDVDEGFRDVTLNLSMYAGKTGTKLKDFSFYNTGNNRYSSVFRRMHKAVLALLPVRGKILNRSGNTLLVDLGKTDNVYEGSVFDVVKKDSVSVSSNSSALVYKDYDRLGTITLTSCSEEISEGILEYDGLYDKTNILDEVVLISNPKDTEKPLLLNENAPVSEKDGSLKKALNYNDLPINKSPSFVDLIRGIY